MKLGLLFKETSGKLIKESVKESESVFIVKYPKLASPDLSSLRQSLKGTNARLMVVQNSVARRALKGSEMEDIVKFIEGPCGMVFAKEEPVETCRVLSDFSKKHEELKLECGFFNGAVLEKKDIDILASLPIFKL
ncbi:50S ribosomal protein L10 [Candidatus Omnitrophota bacterium]